MKKKIKKLISQYVKEYSKKQKIETKWKEPIVKFGDANDEMFFKLKEVVSPNHLLPEDFLEDAKTVIAYFLPFDNSIVKSNIEGKDSSKKWAKAYIETNELISKLNSYIKKKFNDLGYESTLIPATYNFDEEKLISNWSHRHIGYVTGLGTFGLNNLLITKKGCCGRIGSIVTNLKIDPSKRPKEEYCLYKSKGICKKCVQRCISDALKVDSFDRYRCYGVLIHNNKLHSEMDLTHACGKCSVGVPCSVTKPVAKH